MRPRGQSLFAAGLMLALLLLAGGAGAQAVVAPVSQFDLTGFLQEATVDTATDVLSGGTLKLNGHVITVPRNTVVILPAAALTWQQLFELAPAPYAPTQTGMALADLPAPLSTYEVRVIGNRVVSGAADSYIAGLVSISQETLSAGQGYINFIDYANGEMRVGGAVGSSTTGARVRINDPVLPSLGTGRSSKGLSPDVRFTSDQDNPTIRTQTGFPMCLPRVAPTPAQADLRCPERNRPKDALGIFQTIFTFPAPAAVVPGGADPRLQMPFEVGDCISFAGTLFRRRRCSPSTPMASSRRRARCGPRSPPVRPLATSPLPSRSRRNPPSTRATRAPSRSPTTGVRRRGRSSCSPPTTRPRRLSRRSRHRSSPWARRPPS